MNKEQVTGNYTTIVDKIRSGIELLDNEKQELFCLGVGFVKNTLIPEKMDIMDKLLPGDADILKQYPSKPKPVKEYIFGAVLRRIIDFHRKAIERDQKDADSIVKFSRLKDYLCGEIGIDQNTLSDATFNSIIDSASDAYLDKRLDEGISDHLGFIREISAIFVPSNPPIEVKDSRYTGEDAHF